MMTGAVLVDGARLQELEHVEKMWLNACKIGHMHLHMFVVPGESFFEHGIPRVAGELAKSWAELSRLYTEGVKMAQETTRLIEELNEAKARADSAWRSEHCLRLSTESERDAALGAVREIMKQREAAECRLNTVLHQAATGATGVNPIIAANNESEAFHRGAQAMREACARVVDTAEGDARPCVRVADLAVAIRALPLPEAV